MRLRAQSIIPAIVLIRATTIAAYAGGDVSWINSLGGDWNTGSNWSTGLVPDVEDSVSIAIPGAYTVSMNGSHSIGSLSISNINTTLSVQDGSAIDLFGHIQNNGLIEVNPKNLNLETVLYAYADVAFSGDGTLRLAGTWEPSRVYTLSETAISNGENHTIEGCGTIRANIWNYGRIRGNVDECSLVTNYGVTTNFGTYEAIERGAITFSGVTVTQLADGKIVADGEESRVFLSDATIDGGDLISINEGEIWIRGVSTLNDVDFSGLMLLKFHPTLYLQGAFTNNGTIYLDPDQVPNGVTSIALNSSVTLSGNGSFIMWRALIRDADNAVLTQEAGHEIVGNGTIEAQFINYGLVSSDSEEPASIRLQEEDKENNARMQAVGGNDLTINGITVTQGPEAQIVADGIGSEITLSDATIIGGDLAAINGAQINVHGESEFVGVKSDGQVNMTNGSTLRVSESGAMNGKLELNAARLLFEEPMTIDGELEICMSAGSSILTEEGATVTLNQDRSVSGSGHLEASLINNGLVNADHPGSSLILDVNDKINNSVMQAVDSGILQVDGITIDQQSGGSLIADGKSSKINLIDARIIAGDILNINGADTKAAGVTTLEGVSFDGELEVQQSSTLRLNGVAFDGLLTVQNTGTLQVVNSLENNGIIELDSTTPDTVNMLEFAESAELIGPGMLRKTGTGPAPRITTISGQVMLHGEHHSIEGQFEIEAAMINNGLIRATTRSAQTILSVNNKINNGTIETMNGADIVIEGIEVAQSPTGVIQAEERTTEILLVDSTIRNGSLAANNESFIEVIGTSILDGITVSGELGVPHGGILGIKDGFVNNGLIIINSSDSSGNTSMRWDDEFTVQGQGTIRLARPGTQAGLIAASDQVNRAGIGAGQRLEGLGRTMIELDIHGTIAPGLGIGTMTAIKPIDLSSTASFEAEINATSNDKLTIVSPVDLGGTLDVRFVDGFEPAGFWVRTIIQGTDIVGSFDTINAPTPPGDLVTRVVNTGSVLMVGQTCIADLTLDGTLDFFDVSSFLDKFVDQDPEIDFTNDGIFDFFDVSVFLDAFGAGCP